MDTLRYGTALLTVIVYPPVLIFWFLVHPFVWFWRRRGLVVTYAATCLVMAGLGWFVYRLRGDILATEFGTNVVLWITSALTMIIGLVIEVRCRRELTVSTLVGVPELDESGHAGRVLQEGIYAHVRHPRYLGGMFGLLALALFANYLAVYIIVAAYVPLIYLVTVFEERELVDRFGEEYRRYRERVPRFVPRWS